MPFRHLGIFSISSALGYKGAGRHLHLMQIKFGALRSVRCRLRSPTLFRSPASLQQVVLLGIETFSDITSHATRPPSKFCQLKGTPIVASIIFENLLTRIITVLKINQ